MTDLLHRVDKEPAASDKTVAALQFAAFVLSRRLEPELTHAVLVMATGADGSGALNALIQVRSKLQEALESDLGSQVGTHALLTAFAVASEALLEIRPDDTSERLRRSASDLAIATEDETPEIVAASRLWQALLLERAGDRARALTLLPLVLEPPATKAVNHEFFARLLRCRMVAQGSGLAETGYSAAYTLLLQLESASEKWFSDENQRNEGWRAAAYVRYEILRGWRETRGEKATAKECEWFDRSQQRIVDQYFSDPANRAVLRLELAVPMLVEIDDLKE